MNQIQQMAISSPLLTICTILFLFCFHVSAFDPLQALQSSHGLTFTFDTTLGIFNEDYVDQLELRAATRALLNFQNNGTPVAVPDPTGTSDPETVTKNLNQARASVLTLKDQLYGDDGQALDNLLKNETAIAETRLKECADKSNGSFTGGHVRIRVTGKLNTSSVLPTFARMLNITTDTPPTEVKQIIHNLVFPSHPEHYQLITSDKPGVTETWGGIPTRSYLDVLSAPPSEVVQYRDYGYPIGISARGYLGDDHGTTVMWTLEQYRDIQDGVEVDLRIWYPSACAEEYVHDHVEHLCVEFRNGFHLIAGIFGI